MKVRIIERNPMVKKLLEIYITEYMGFCLQDPPDVILLDAQEISSFQKLWEAFPGVKIIVMTSYPEHTYLRRAKMLGAYGFWYQQPDADALRSLLVTVAAGGSCFPENQLGAKLGTADSKVLTNREWEVLQQVVMGKTDAQIAQAISCSVPTVKHHIQKLREKTGLPSRVKLAVDARVTGLVIPEE